MSLVRLIVRRDLYNLWTIARFEIGGSLPDLVDVTEHFDNKVITLLLNLCE